MTKLWPDDLNFSERIGSTLKISTAYKSVVPQCTGPEVKKYSKTAEDGIRKEAHSLAEYHMLCDNHIKALLESVAPSPNETIPGDEHVFAETASNGAQIGRYTNAHHHADGLFSEVFSAVPPATQGEDGEHQKSSSPSLVALKVTIPDQMSPPHDSTREARILTSCLTSKQETHIIPLLELFPQPRGRLVLAFPFQKHDLATLLHQNTPPQSSRPRILHNLFTALAHLHSLGILHRDVKPANILLTTPSGPAYLADFGIAWSPEDPASEPADAKILDVGTTCYRPPELLFGNTRYGPALDLWAAGCVAAQVICLGSKTLFDAGDLGSELALIKSLFETLGTPDEGSWPEATTLPDWGKMNFRKYPRKSWEQILPDCDEQAKDFVSVLVRFESSERMTAEEALRHPYLQRR